MGFIIRDGKVVEAKQRKLTPKQKRELYVVSDKQKQVQKEILERRRNPNNQLSVEIIK